MNLSRQEMASIPLLQLHGMERYLSSGFQREYHSYRTGMVLELVSGWVLADAYYIGTAVLHQQNTLTPLLVVVHWCWRSGATLLTADSQLLLLARDPQLC